MIYSILVDFLEYQCHKYLDKTNPLHAKMARLARDICKWF